jgi:hypothetical protein
LPYYQTKQNEFEVQHNEALSMLDALVMLAVLDRDLSAPPSSPALGDRYIVNPTGTGDFAGNDNRIAQYDIGGWNFYAPKVGWTCYVQDEAVLLMWSGTAWVNALAAGLFNAIMLGVNTTADTTNRLSVKSDGVLLSHDDITPGTGDMRVALNKNATGKDVSLNFQDGYSARALMGLLADDDFQLKVTPDATNYYSSFRAYPGLYGRTNLRNAARRQYSEWLPRPNSTTIDQIGLGVTAVAGTATAGTLSATSMWGSAKRLLYATAATAGSSAQVAGNDLLAWIGNAAGLGGFYLMMRGGFETHVSQARFFMGLRSSVVAIGNVSPTALTNCVGIGYDSGDTQMSLITNGPSGTATKIPLGAAFVVGSLELYELVLACEPNGSEIRYRVEHLNGGDVASGSISTGLPANTAFMTPNLWGNNGTTASATKIGIVGMYLESVSLQGSRGFELA